MPKQYLMDCTLRDGGYVNNWGFDDKCINNIILGLENAHLDFIELGIMGKTNHQLRGTKFNSFCEIAPLLNKRQPGIIYTVMLNYAEKDNFTIDFRNEYLPDGIRLAFFKSESQAAIEFGKLLQEQGYLLFLQAMATDMYSENELHYLLDKVNQIKPYAFYLVDSFGTLYNDDVSRLYSLIESKLDCEIIFGFHAHNNLQMAVSNTIQFIELGKKHDRNVAIDASIMGMGRGAGNANLELVMQYLNQKCGMNYDTSIVLALYENNLKEIYEEYYWGYTPQYFLASQKNTNSAYIWYLATQEITSIAAINKILDQIPFQDRYTLRKKLVNEIIAK